MTLPKPPLPKPKTLVSKPQLPKPKSPLCKNSQSLPPFSNTIRSLTKQMAQMTLSNPPPTEANLKIHTPIKPEIKRRQIVEEELSILDLNTLVIVDPFTCDKYRVTLLNGVNDNVSNKNTDDYDNNRGIWIPQYNTIVASKGRPKQPLHIQPVTTGIQTYNSNSNVPISDIIKSIDRNRLIPGFRGPRNLIYGVNELKDICKSLGLPSSGRKDELVARILSKISK